MTQIPEGRQAITPDDMAKLHPSTWQQEVEQLRNGLQAIVAATDLSQSKHRPEVVVQIVRHLARAALGDDQ
jgi:hypothetical protein